MEILDKLTSPNDIKNMSIKDLYILCEDLRQCILENTSKNGGHLASNLGVVEITVAIHNVFDTSRDRLIFDVGHQCYAHKILSGRKEQLQKLRSYQGISGFPNPDESIHDAFVAGHASTSVSVALGMARARTATGGDYSVIAITGDGALTGGLAFEGLSDAGHSGEPLIIILNDNEMSITENVGGLSKHLAYLRMRPYYLSVKKLYRKTIGKIPYFGKGLTNFLRSIKAGVKNAFHLPSSMFENMGFKYIGPVDGHNIKEVCRLLKVARDMSMPVIIHLKTTKGKGYKFAEERPEVYHGVSSFDIDTGKPSELTGETYASAFGSALTDIALGDRRVCAITAAMQSGTGLDRFAGRLPGQFYDVGIAEGHAVTMAGALAKQGMLPVCAIYSTFMQRAYDMLFHDVCLPGQHVVFAVDRAGLVSDDGQTHQGIYDVGMFLQMPGLTVLCPSCISELKEMLRYAIYDLKGPVAIRYPRGGDCDSNFEGCVCPFIAQNSPPYEPMLICPGKDAAIVAYGRMTGNAVAASELLEKQGISTAVIRITELSATNMDKLLPILGDIDRVFVTEECVQAGSLASKLALESSTINSKNHTIRIIPINLGNNVPPPATTGELMKLYGLDPDGITKYICQSL